METWHNTKMGKLSNQGFSLLELSMVLVIIGFVVGMGMQSGKVTIETARLSSTQTKMATIEKALMAFRDAQNRLPCPGDLTIAEGAANFGVEGATAGTCTGGTPAANSSAAGATNTSKTGVEGAVPVVTLGLPNDMMYDGWGHRIRYVVDKSATANGAFTTVKSNCTNLAITVKDATSGNTRTSGAVYALISHGANGHGGYGRKGTIASTGSTNTDEQTNCHCDASAAAASYAPTYVQRDPTANSASATDSFDDIVTFKERWQMMVAWEKPASCAPDGYIYVADYVNTRIQKFDISGNYVSQFAVPNRPIGVAVDSTGNVYVTTAAMSWTGNAFLKYDSSGNLLLQTPADDSSSSANGHFKDPRKIAVDPSNNVWVYDAGNNRVEKFDSSGNWLLSIGGPSPYTCTTAPAGSPPACAAGSGNGQFSTDGGVMKGMYVDSSYLYVTDSYYVQKFTLAGAFVSKTASAFTTGGGDGQFNYTPACIIKRSDGTFWLCDQGNGRLQKFDSTFTTYQAQTLPNGWGSGNGQFAYQWDQYVTIDSNDNIWVTDYTNNRVQKFDSTGAYVTQFGTSGSGNGQFTGPFGIAITSSR